MTNRGQVAPPRHIEPGDVVAAFSEHLGEWTAAQITDLDPGWPSAGVLELDWSGPEPTSVADLGEASPLRLTHHSWTGKLSHCNYEWVLPRSYKIIGSLPLLHDQRSSSYGRGWGIGQQLFQQRRWEQGHHDRWSGPHALECTSEELDLRARSGESALIGARSAERSVPTSAKGLAPSPRLRGARSGGVPQHRLHDDRPRRARQALADAG